MKTLSKLFENNKRWAEDIKSLDPNFFERLSKQQNPRFLWIGCSDSRVPANQIIGLDPGEVFVHRNVGNLVTHSDMNCLSVIEYAVDALKVTDIIVCGHYCCGAIKCAVEGKSYGLIDNWIMHIKDVMIQHKSQLETIKDPHQLQSRLSELNVKQQVLNVCHTSIVQDAWKRGQTLNIHGWIYGLKDGRLKDLGITVQSADQIDDIFRYDGIHFN